MSDRRYDPSQIEPKWQELWAREGTWEVSNEPAADSGPDDADAREKSYVLEMLPYPSGEPHIGHLKNYALGDAIAHFHRRTGHRVLHPMGYDAFGLPAENHAIKTGVHPRKSTDESIAAFQRAFRSWGISIDWSREIRHARAELLPLDAVDLPEAARARPRVPQGGRGQVVPQRRDRARQRAGDRRPLRALRRPRSSCASSSSGSSASPTTPTACSTTSTRSTGPSTSRRCSATGSAAARAPRSCSAARSSIPPTRSTTRCSRPDRTRCSARPSS